MPNLTKRNISVWLDFEQAGRLDGIAKERGMDTGEVVADMLEPVLEREGRWVLLNIEESTYQAHLEFFDGDVDMAQRSMAVSVEMGGEDLDRAMRVAEKVAEAGR